jgi:hypothetical protein
MREGTIGTLVLLTFLGMVGLYVGFYLAWQKYQKYAPAIDKISGEVASVSSAGSSIGDLLSAVLPSK